MSGAAELVELLRLSRTLRRARAERGAQRGATPAAKARSAELPLEELLRIERRIRASGGARVGTRTARIVWHPDIATKRIDAWVRQFTVELTENGQRTFPVLARGPLNLTEARNEALTLLARRRAPLGSEVR